MAKTARKRSIDEILKETMPDKSKNEYIKAWELFKKFVGEDRKPKEEDYLQYFDFMKSVTAFVAVLRHGLQMKERLPRR